MLCSELRSVLANLDGSFENGPDGKYSSQFVRSDGSQAHGCDASAGCAIRIPAKLAGSDLCSQVCRQRLGRERKDTILRPLWRRGELPDQPLSQVQLRKLPSQLRHLHNCARPLLGIEDFRHSVSHLRSEQAEPYLLDLRTRRPEFQEFL